MKTSICRLMIGLGSALLASISWAQTCDQGEGAPPDTSSRAVEEPPEVVLRTDTAFAYCALEMTGSYDQHAAAFEKLYGAAMQQGIYGGVPFGIYWNSPSNTAVEKLSWDVGFILPAGSTPKDPLTVKKWIFTKMAVLEYSGAFGGEGMTNAYNKVFGWIGEHGYKPAGPIMESYLNIPSPDESGVMVGSIEIIVPIEKIPEAKEKKAE